VDQKAIIEARKKAEMAVEGMADPALKLKAFEQIFARLLEGDEVKEQSRAAEGRRSVARVGKRTLGPRPETLPGRLLALKDEGFFRAQRTLSEIREELGSRGHHYPLTSLSGAMQSLVRNRELRRERVKSGAKKTYKYANV
jgi:hypothetical protein